MCLAMYLFTDNSINERKFEENNPCMYIRCVTEERENKVLDWNLGKKNIYYIGSAQGCGCGWCEVYEYDPDDLKQEKIKDRELLFNLLREQDFKGSHLIVCWEGDQGVELIEKQILNIEEIKDAYFEFEELVDYILQT
jgi:hypothetical protein